MAGSYSSGRHVFFMMWERKKYTTGPSVKENATLMCRRGVSGVLCVWAARREHAVPNLFPGAFLMLCCPHCLAPSGRPFLPSPRKLVLFRMSHSAIRGYLLLGQLKFNS